MLGDLQGSDALPTRGWWSLWEGRLPGLSHVGGSAVAIADAEAGAAEEPRLG